MIPPQLQNPAFRFIRVAAKSKRPIDQDWQETANYQFDSPSLLQHLQDGGNYGIICGPGEVRVLDCDELARLEELGVLAKFPQTFAVQSRAGRVHRYYLIPELKKKIVLFDPILKDENGQPLHLGEIQGPGTQIVAPGSIHSVTGEPYKVIDDSPIAALSLEEVKAAIEGLKTSRVTEQILHRTETSPKEDDQFRNIRIDDIAYPKGETRRIGDEIQGTHPVHGSTTGKNFRIDLKKNTWYCFPEGTLVNTPRGLTEIEKIVPGELVLSRVGKSQKVLETFVREYSGNVYKIESCIQPIQATEGHEILVAEVPVCGRIYEEYTKCSPTCSRRNRQSRNGKCHGNGNPEIKWVRIENIDPAKHFLIIPRSNDVLVDNIDGYSLDGRLGNLIGWYLAEGNIGHKTTEGRRYPRTHWTLSLDEGKEVDGIRSDLFNKFGYHASVYRREDEGIFFVTNGSTKFARLMQNFGEGAKNKAVGKCLHATKEVTNAILEAYIKGDGCTQTTRNRIQITTVSKTLALETQLLLLKSGKTSQCWISDWDTRNGKGNYDKYTITTYKTKVKSTHGWLDAENWYVPIKAITKHAYKGTVYNIETEDHTYQVPFVVHNCDRCHSGGGPALWLAVESGILRCDQAASGALRGDDFRKVLRIAEDKGYIKKNLPYFKKLNRKAEPEKTKEITLLDVVDEHLLQAGPKKGQVEYTFNPDKAADAIINTYNLVATPDEKIWIYENGYYKDNGKVIIDKILDRVAGKLYTINVSKETQKKVFLRSMEEYDIFDQNPYLLCVRNGVIDLLTGDFLEHSPGYYLTSAAPVEYDPSKRPTEFIKFLEGACTNDDDRLTLIDWIVACACLTEFEYILFLTGHGSNGKHVYEALLQAFFGSDATEAISLEELMNSRFAMGYLRRARICISSETNPDKTKTELIKKISGNDWISSDVKNKDRARFKAYTQLIFDSNSMPIFEDTSYGFARRFTRVVMPYKFVDHPDAEDPLQKKADRHLLEKLTTDQELSGILNLIIIRAKEIALDRRIHRKDDSFERYEEQSYSVSDFMEKFIQFDPMMRDLPSWQESSDYLFKKFEEYATLTIGAKTSRKKFSHVLGKENGESSRTVRPDNLDNLPVRGFRGLRFDEIEFNRFIEEKRDYFTKCNTCNDSVTICNDNNNDSSECNVTDVTIFRRILTALENGVCLPMGESSEMIVTRTVTTPDDSENEKFVTMLDSLRPQDLEVLQRSLNIMLRKRDPVTPFVLAIHCENLGTKIAPKVCGNWLKADGWIENKPGWLKN